ncbi:Gmad2 immunoglobulin-like domain-containing protein [Nocardioides sp.]|uniref:Gmad2 immunoglobulin-like domain-containing protein n=1 Tax=Nocardioides sp. TaxID=35761 RepID=UPI002617E227|nr:Gmad2 immunoglobulin-like domain-containing protein [Nocardioides sp.]
MNDDQDLRDALSTAVEDVEPTDRLVAIRQGTRRTTRRRRSWWAAGGGALAVASVVAVALVAGSPSPQRAAEPAASPSPVPEPARTTYPVYYVGPGPDGPDAPAAMLYRSYVESASPLAALMATPTDPDYRTLWPADSLLSYDVQETEIEVVVSPTAPVDDELARQQLVYTLQTLQQTDLPVTLSYESIDRGTAPIAKEPELEVLSHMSIDEPSEGSTFTSGETLPVTGRGNSFEASGQCALLSEDGAELGATLAQMDGWIEPRLYAWELSIDLTDVPAGTYTLTCITDDPTGGTEGRGTDTDTRTVIVE